MIWLIYATCLAIALGMLLVWRAYQRSHVRVPRAIIAEWCTTKVHCVVGIFPKAAEGAPQLIRYSYGPKNFKNWNFAVWICSTPHPGGWFQKVLELNTPSIWRGEGVDYE